MRQQTGQALHELPDPLAAPVLGECFQLTPVQPDTLALRAFVNRDRVALPLPEPRSAQVDEFAKEFLSDYWKKKTETYTNHVEGRARGKSIWTTPKNVRPARQHAVCPAGRREGGWHENCQRDYERRGDDPGA